MAPDILIGAHDAVMLGRGLRAGDYCRPPRCAFPAAAARPVVEVFVAHACAVVAAGVRAMLDGEPGLRVWTGAGAPASLGFDVIVADLEAGARYAGRPDASGLRHGARHVLVLAAEVGEATAQAAFRRGVHGCLPLTVHRGALVQAVRRIAAGELQVSPDALQALQPAPPPEALTTREAEVLELIVVGRCDKRIAADLAIALPTVKTHVRAILAKLHVASRTQAAVAAVQGALRGIDRYGAVSSRAAP